MYHQDQKSQELEEIVSLRLSIADCNIKIKQLSRVNEKLIIAEQKINQLTQQNIKLKQQINSLKKIQKNIIDILNVTDRQESLNSVLPASIITLKKNNQNYLQKINQLTKNLQYLRQNYQNLEIKLKQKQILFIKKQENNQNIYQKKQNQNKLLSQKIKELQNLYQDKYSILKEKINHLEGATDQLKQQRSRFLDLRIKKQNAELIEKQCYQLLSNLQVKQDQYVKNYLQRSSNYFHDFDSISKKNKYDLLFGD